MIGRCCLEIVMIRYHEPLKAALNILMRLTEFDTSKEKFTEMFRKFLPIAMETIEINTLPKFVFSRYLDHPTQPTFGMYINGENTLYVALANRHPVDILRTIAHELVHYKQDSEHQLNIHSGDTGSPEENQAHQIAGIVMRHFNKFYPEYLKSVPILESLVYQQYNHEDFTGRAKPGSRPGSLKRKAGKSKDEKITATDLSAMSARANRMKKSKNKDTHRRGVQLARQVSWYRNFHN